MAQFYSIEELVIDDSFINYCFRTNPDDITKWEQYLASHPDEKENAEEARTMVFALKLMLKGRDVEQSSPVNLLQSIKEEIPDPSRARIIKLPERDNNARLRRLAISVAVVFVFLAATSVFFLFKTKNLPDAAISFSRPEKKPTVFSVGLGEKKMIILPDSTKVYLNAGSVLTLADDFGKENRIVNLKGEAMFDVTHNKALPFLVHTDKYYVRVLGTVFNVKAYPGDKVSETSLVSGKVEIFMEKDSADYLYKVLKPRQKFVMSVNANGRQNTRIEESSIHTEITPLSYNQNDENIETAWAHNRLIIENEKFADIKEKIERWYDVRLIFENEEVKRYSFTASFETENINQVMKALQASYYFTFKIDGRDIKIGR